jgi:polyisoprenoid-binding protein YceI
MKPLIIAIPMLLVLLAGPVSAADFTLEKPHTQIEFVATHLALSRVHGQLPMVSGTATIGADNVPTAANVTFDAAAINTQFEPRDNTLRKSYLESDKYPTITFVERSARGTASAFTMIGDLTIHGVTKSVSVAFSVDAAAAVRGKKNVSYTGTTKIDRRDFGMSFGPLLDGALVVGNEITINIETTAVEQ